MMCNIMTGEGFDLGFMGGFGMAWFGLVIIIFIILFARKWVGEEMGIGFNILGAFGGSIIPYLVVVTISCQFKWALAAGLIGLVVGGFLLGQFMDGGDGF